MLEGTKKCGRCKKVLIHEQYYISNAKPDGRQSVCIECQKSHANTPERRYRAYLKNAAKRGYLFILSIAEFYQLWRKPCYYCGDMIDGIGIDRVNNKLDYKIDNVVPCCGTCNIMKGTLGYETFIQKCIGIAQKHKN